MVNNKHIPKIIWSYWDSQKLPDSVEECVASWRRTNPDYKIHLLNKKNYKSFVSHDIENYKMNDSPARFSDFLRLELLSTYGGIWIDSSILVNESLDGIIYTQAHKNLDFVGYYISSFTTNETYPIIESWFLASPKASEFVTSWNKEFLSINKYASIEDYVQNIQNIQNVDLQNIPDNLKGYLAIHVAVQKIMQKQQHKNFNIYVQDAVSKGGPFYYLNANNWDSKKSLESICKKEELRTPIIKFRGGERKYIEASDELKSCLFKTKTF